MHSTAQTVEEYLESLPDDRQEVISYLRDQIVHVLPRGYEEAMNWGMITYQVPLSVYPDTYNKQPLMLAALASQKNHLAIYLTVTYTKPGEEDWLREEFKKAGKKLDMGKSCIRFKKLDDLALEPILDLIKKTEMEPYVEWVRSVRTAQK